ncbi:MAG: hypothetical protein HYT47_01625 [Candidatus Vogelbacteria bacterium]|nr:hypothetical protein [Candidatus Vogelbacteria bacterium]
MAKLGKTKKRDTEPAWFKSYHEDQKRHMSALSEDFQDKVQVVAELALDIKKTVDSHSKILESHTEMIGKIMVQLEEIKGELKQKVDYSDFVKLEKRVVRLEVLAGH